MNILMVHPHEIYSKIEPWTIRVSYLAKEFIKSGHQVKIIYFPVEYKFDKPFYKDGIEHIPYSRWGGLRLLFRNCSDLFKIAKWADIIHFQKCFYYASLPSLLNSWRLDKPIHYDWDDWEEKIYYDSVKSPSRAVGLFIRIFERTIPVTVDTVSVASTRLQNLCITLGVTPDKIFLAPVGADIEKFNPSISGNRIKSRYNISSPLVLYVGQLHGAQYVEMFIRASKILIENGMEVGFMIVGDGEKSSILRKLTRQLGLEHKIIFTGAIKHDLIPEYLAACDIAVACFKDNDITRCKSPLKIAEYLASGKPIVASEVGEIKNMVRGCGILTRPGDIYDLASGIERLLKDRDLRVELGKRARQRAQEKYNWSQTAENLLKAYQAALACH
jgi:glycosyltransferase involved in cell wall biosynthesis